MKLTVERLELMQAIHQIGLHSEFKVAPLKEIIKKMGKSRGTVAKAITQLKNAGYVENPIFGGWRLTEQGREALYEFVTNSGNI